MGLFSGIAKGLGIVGSVVGGIIGGNEASDAQADAARDTLNFNNEVFNYAKDVNAPFIQAGQDSVNALRDIIINNDPDGRLNITPSGENLLRDAMSDTQGRLAASGLSDSGFGRNALLDRAITARTGLRNNALNEYFRLAGFGPGANAQAIGAGANAAVGIGNANQALGEAKASRYVNYTNQVLGGVEQGANLLSSFL